MVSKKSAGKNSSVVEASIQVETLADGTTNVREMGTLTVSLVSWLKSKGQSDTVEIADDGSSAQYNFEITSIDGETDYDCFIDVFEEFGLITLCAYYNDREIDVESLGSDVYALLAKTNFDLSIGQFQLVGNEDAKTLRYYSSVKVGAPSSERLESSDNEVIHFIYENLFDSCCSALNENIQEVLDYVGKAYAEHPGSLEAFDWPVTREQALEALDYFVEYHNCTHFISSLIFSLSHIVNYILARQYTLNNIRMTIAQIIYTFILSYNYLQNTTPLGSLIIHQYANIFCILIQYILHKLSVDLAAFQWWSFFHKASKVPCESIASQ